MDMDIKSHELAMQDKRIARNRRAIYTGLKPYLPADELIDAMILWQLRYSTGQAYALHSFLSDLGNNNNYLKMIRSDLHRSLTAALFGPDEALEDDPMTQIERQISSRKDSSPASIMPKIPPSASKQEAPPASPMTLVFEAFLGRFLDSLDNEHDTGLQVREYLVSHLDKIPLEGLTANNVADWLFGRQQRLANGLSHPEMRALLHIAYVLACEYIGPVVTDKLLADAVRHGESLGLSRQFTPRSFL